MKQKILFLFVFIAFTASAFGQARELTEKEYNSLEKTATSNFEKIPYRETTFVEEFKDGKIISTTTIIEDNTPPNKSKWTSIEKSAKGTDKIEVITIGNIQYRKENNGKWIKEGGDDKSESGESSNRIELIGNEAPNTKKYSLEESELNNQKVRIYTVITKYNDSPDITFIFKRWINAKNLILKTDDSQTENGVLTSRSVSTYEYNLKNVKIEAPIR